MFLQTIKVAKCHQGKLRRKKIMMMKHVFNFGRIHLKISLEIDIFVSDNFNPS
jgi:hypothetical protein